MLLMAWMEERRIHSLHGRVELDKGNLTVQQLGIETTATTFTVFILAAAATITSSWEKKEVLCNMRTPGCILSSTTSSLHHHPPSSTFLHLPHLHAGYYGNGSGQLRKWVTIRANHLTYAKIVKIVPSRKSILFHPRKSVQTNTLTSPYRRSQITVNS
ncbi:hypothetical protein LR48_Vigan03g273300 [Vigna angularis]|uniref:Uncharacterized protein n=1 Tax=Phaseolus angularis TaxID=3914 RepID=A0A0L9U9E9_PHAAN|nr:hypothetical protein LR48_Vigan03g273300 [Vigna angularis]